MAKSSPRNISKKTIARLYSLAGNRCSFPGCNVELFTDEDETNLSNICHIEDANQSKNKKDRFNPNMTDDERSGYNNLILLCPNHHVVTNDPQKYSVEDLNKMKYDHEKSIRELQSGQNLIARNPSILSIVINNISNVLINDSSNNENIQAPNTEEKILFNNIINYKPIIEEYSVYQGKLSGIYEEIENQGSNKKDVLLQNIRILYLIEKGKYNNIDGIRDNADTILETIKNKIWERIENNDNRDKELPIEALEIAILIVMVDAFMRCKILEEPIKL